MGDELPAWVVFRHDLHRRAWTEIGCTNAITAVDAFRFLVTPPNTTINPEHINCHFRVFQLKDSAHLAIDLQLRDLDSKVGP